jgi:hypothetical protein
MVWLVLTLFGVAVFGWGLARSKATLATENAERARSAAEAAEAERHIADDRLKLSSLRQVCRAWADVINARSAEARQIAQNRWNSLVNQESVKAPLAGHVNLDQLWTFADEAYMQQNAPPAGPPKSSTEAYHVRLMEGIEKLRNELLGCETVRPSLETARQVAFEQVRLCINHTNDLLVEKKHSYGDAAPYIREFWNQYWGDMILVEGNQVAQAMDNYGRVLNGLRDHAVVSAESAPRTDLVKPPHPSAVPASKASDAKGSRPDRPTLAKDTAPPPLPIARPQPGSPAAAPSPKESELLEQLKTLPLDQVERLIRKMRERPIPDKVLSDLRTAHKQLRDALDAEGKRPLQEVLRH